METRLSRTKHKSDVAAVLRKSWYRLRLSVRHPSRAATWDAIVLTAASPEQAELYHWQLTRAKRMGRIAPSTVTLAVPDPLGQRIGSGAATLHAIHALALHFRKIRGPNSQVADTDNGGAVSEGRGDGEVVDDLEQMVSYIAKKHILLLHAGGDSKRVPWANPMGKVFLPLPYLAADDPDGPVPLLFDHILAIASCARQAFKNEGGMFTMTGDVLPCFDASDMVLPEDTSCIITVPITLDIASNHGVVVASKSGDVENNVNLVDNLLQKPSVEELVKNNAILDDGRTLLDTGLIAVRGKGWVELVTLACTCQPMISELLKTKKEMSLYEDLVAAWVPAKHDWLRLRPSGEELVSRLGKQKMYSYCAYDLSFLHFGTSSEVLDHLSGAGSGLVSQRHLCSIPGTTLSDIAASAVILASKIAPAVSIGEDSLIYDSTISSGIQIGSLSIVVGINVPDVSGNAAENRFRFILPDRHCLWEVPLVEYTGRVIVYCGLHDNPKISLSKDGTFCGKQEKKFDHKGNAQQRAAYHKNLKDCIKWYQKVEKEHLLEVERLQNLLNASEKKCADTEEKMKNMVDELNAINLKVATLEEKLAKEESEKMAAIRSHKKEKEERVALSAELEKVREQKLVVEQRAIKFEDDYNRTQEYNKSLQQYNSKLQSDVNTMDESRKRAENEKLTMVENLSNLRGHKKALEDQLASHKASLDDALKQNECLRGQLQEVRDDRDHHVKENHDLKAEVVKHFAELDKLVRKTKDLEETCSSQMMQVDSLKNERDQLRHERDVLKQERDAAHEKIEMSDLSASEISTRFELQKRVERELRDRIAEYELKIIEGDRLRKKLHNDIQELKGNIRVFCRVRPLLPDDATEVPVISYPTSTEDLGRSIDLVQSGQKYHFTFDKVFDHAASQNDVFEEISQLVQSALDGYKVCIFAYGQTGSGKTYTMMGRPENPDQKGLIPRSVDQIFQTSQSLQAQGWKYTMQASMLEIYNETIRDLLSTNRPSGTELTRTESGVGKQYTIKHDVNGNTHVSDLTIIDVCSKREISSLLQQAAQSRSVGKTHMNEQSSRSHLVFTLRITGINENTEQQVQGVLNLIDLAGSERLSRSGATGERLKETQAINKSLSSLSDVISALAKKDDHIPFRNSKLTYLLQPCLGGDSKTLMFVNVSPDSTSVGESLCSLRFAHRVNACEIGVPRRQTTARPTTSDSRLSYG